MNHRAFVLLLAGGVTNLAILCAIALMHLVDAGVSSPVLLTFAMMAGTIMFLCLAGRMLGQAQVARQYEPRVRGLEARSRALDKVLEEYDAQLELAETEREFWRRHASDLQDAQAEQVEALSGISAAVAGQEAQP